MQGDTVRLPRYAGKLVYLLLWDTRKPACQRELPYLKELIRGFSNKPITFVELTLDEQVDTWQKLVATHPPGPGVQVLVPPLARTALLNIYHPDTLPAAMLLAEDRTILQFKARRPSHQLLHNDISAAFGRAAAFRAVKLPTAGGMN